MKAVTASGTGPHYSGAAHCRYGGHGEEDPMISLTAITVVFGLGWAVRKLWKLAAPAIAAAFAPQVETREQTR